MAIELTVNGETLSVSEAQSVLDFLQGRQVNPQRVVVERNGQIVDRAAYGETRLAAGDVLEIVVFVGGG